MRSAVIFAVFCLLGFVLYSNILNSPFVFDDNTAIKDNLPLRVLVDVPGVFFMHPSRFITNLTFATNYALNGLDTQGYHLVNIGIHILVASMVFLVSKSLFRSALPQTFRSNHISVVAGSTALLFLIHPIQTQAVTYITQRSAELGALFFLLAWYFFTLQTRTYYLCSLLAAVIGFLSKDNTFILPVVLSIYYMLFLHRGRSVRQGIVAVLPFFILASCVYAGLYMVRVTDNPYYVISDKSHADIAPLTYHLTQTRVTMTYLRLLFFPFNQNLDYDYPLSTSITDIRVIFSITGLIALCVIAVCTRRKHSVITFGTFFFLSTLGIEAIVPLSDVIMEHRLYLPSIGVFIVVVYLLHLLKNQQLFRIVIVMLLVSLSCLTYIRNQAWKDELTLWMDTVSKSPNKSRPHANLGVAYKLNGDTFAAEQEYRKALTLDPTHIRAYINFANIYLDKKDYKHAASIYKSGLEHNLHNSGLIYELANVYITADDPVSASELLTSSLETTDNPAILYFSLSGLAMNEKDYTQAKEYLNTAMRLKPEYNAIYSRLGDIAYLEKNEEEAYRQYLKVLSMNPNELRTLENTGKLAINRKEFATAERLLRRALYISPESTDTMYNLAIAYYFLNKKNLATHMVQNILEIKPADQQARNLLQRL